MKTIGLIGGISWESTQEYYRLINNEVNRRLGGRHSASISMYSFDFEEIMEMINKKDNKGIGKRLVEESVKLENSGAEMLLLCANTAHRWAEEVKASVRIPLIHIADATGRAIQKQAIKQVLLLGTFYTMERDFIKGKIYNDFNVHVTVPGKSDREEVSRIIFDELIVGEFKETSRKKLLEIIANHQDIDGVILGCTELPLLVKMSDCSLPLFNTTHLHAMAAVDYALSK